MLIKLKYSGFEGGIFLDTNVQKNKKSYFYEI